jgi:hypothetical protein
MRCIQGSDAHRLVRKTKYSKHLGVGDRVTEILLDDLSFEAIAKVFSTNDFSLTRPYRGPAEPVDFVQMAREEGESIVQSFHPSMAHRGGYLNRILRDICAMSNTNGGTIYIGVSDNPNEKPSGIDNPKQAIERLRNTISNRFSPEPDIHLDSIPSQNKQVVRVIVQPGDEIPYAIDHSKIFIRDDTETNLAVRDEVVRLVEKSLSDETGERPPVLAPLPPPGSSITTPGQQGLPKPEPPRTGVEIVHSEKRKGTIYHTVRDLRNGNEIKNVTRKSARKLWRYAITQEEEDQVKPDKLKWHNNIALIDRRQHGDNVWYDLAMRDDKGKIHVYYGVNDSGINEGWMPLIEKHNNR